MKASAFREFEFLDRDLALETRRKILTSRAFAENFLRLGDLGLHFTKHWFMAVTAGLVVIDLDCSRLHLERLMRDRVTAEMAERHQALTRRLWAEVREKFGSQTVERIQSQLAENQQP